MASEWEGDWETDFGDLTIKPDGKGLKGTYDSRGGTLTGVAYGTEFYGTWHQFYTDRPGVKGGRFYLCLDEEGDFEGHWNYGNRMGPPWDGDWEGTKDD